MFERLRNLFRGNRPQPSRLRVGPSDVALIGPAGAVAAIRWDELGAVVIETNDTGPSGDDVIWHLFAADAARRLTVPQAMEGSRELLRALQRLPDFDNAAVLAAMGSTGLDSFLCWEAPSWSGRDQTLVALGRSWRARHPGA